MKLTKREKQVLKLIAKGLISEEIAKELKISQRTVDAHRANAMKGAGAKNSAHLLMMAIEKGELPLERCARVKYVPERDIEACKMPPLK